MLKWRDYAEMFGVVFATGLGMAVSISLLFVTVDWLVEAL
jgi:hypothetical protein